jgi:hypothetical protein
MYTLCCASGAILAVASCAASADGVGVVTVRVDTGISSVGNTAVVGTAGALGGFVVGLVAMDGFLDLVDDA